MKPDHPDYGPQLDPVDGTIGTRTQLVKRWVLVHGPGEEFFTARQGRYTRTTKEEAEEWIDRIKNSNHKDLVPDDLRAIQMWCYPGHFDPASRIEEPES